MRLLHTADWHLGRQFHNISLLDDQRIVLEQIIDLIERERVDVVLVAGDIFDRSIPPATAVTLLDDTLDRICNRLGVPVIMIAGNHDGSERLAFGARQLSQAGLHIIGPLWKTPDPIVLQDPMGEVAFYGIPYADPAEVRAHHGVDVSSHDQAMAYLTSQIKQHEKGVKRRTIVLAHCFLSGFDSSESERPLCVGGAEQVSASHFADFDYVALGHLHGRQFRGLEHIRYPGSILKYSFSEERQHKSVTLVDVGAAGVERIEQIDLSPRHDLRTIEGTLEQLLEQGRSDPHCEDYLLARLTDTHAILDVMGKLRAVYPNILHLERPFFMRQGDGRGLQREQLKQGELEMFRDFFQQTSGEPLSREQERVVSALLTTIHRDGAD